MDLVERLNSMSFTLRQEVSMLSENVLTTTGDGSWSIKDVTGHLCDHSHILHKRLWMMINLEEPQLISYDQEAVARERNANAASTETLLNEFAAQRAQTVDMLANLVHWNWARTGRHPYYGRISIRQQVDKWITHEDEHIEQIRVLKAAQT